MRKWRAWTAVSLLLVTVVASDAALASNDPLQNRKSSVDGQIDQLKETLEGASKDVVAAAVAVRTAQLQLAAARAASKAAQAALAAAVAHDQDVAATLAVAEAEQAKAQRQVAAGLAAQADTRTQLGRMARDAYIGSGLSGLALALGADSPEAFTDRVALSGVALRSQGDALDELAVQQADLRARTSKVEAVAAEIVVLKKQSAAAVAARTAAQQAAAAAQARIATVLARQQAALKVAQGKAAAERNRLSALQTEQSKLQATLAARARAEAARRRAAGRGSSGGSAPAPAPASGVLSYPVAGPITSGFGLRYHPILHIWRLHSGTDFGVACGTPVHAAAAGTIISAGWAGGYGNRIVIDHGYLRGGDLATTYNHLTRIVASGSVTRGQLIAYSGTTGLSTGCHLHFETLVNGSYVNPAGWL
jgi:murein DD-endopeptidase MepM/ murein hydrolase activator NlpD